MRPAGGITASSVPANLLDAAHPQAFGRWHAENDGMVTAAGHWERGDGERRVVEVGVGRSEGVVLPLSVARQV